MAEGASPVVIVGSGLAGWTVVRELRKRDQLVPVTLVSSDSGDFYSKPMLSNALAQGKSAQQLVNTPASAMAQQLGVTLLAHTEVLALDREHRLLQTRDGAIRYGRLVLALGADPVRVPLAGSAADQALCVNDLEGYAQLRRRMQGRKRITVMGAGLIGCEFANDMLSAGYEVDLVDPGEQVLGRLLPAQAAQRVQQALQGVGVRLHLGARVLAAETAAQGLQLQLSNGESLDTEVLVCAVGLQARTALAQAAGLETRRGIVVDRRLQTGDPDIFALGDCAEIDGRVLPYVLPLMHAARAIASELCGVAAPLRWPAMPVVVKTPCAPVVVVPPPLDAPGNWSSEVSEQGVESRFESAKGELLGFALVGSAAGRKSLLLEQLVTSA